MKRVILLSVLILLISLAYSFAAVPCKINYQGRLIKDNVPVDGQVNMEFKLYTQLTGGTLKKTISMSNVPVYNGLFRAVLDLEGIDWAAGETMYLQVKVGSDILTPREALYAYPYAINTHLLEGATKEYFLNTSAETQKKDGGLNIMGNVGIGTTSPGQKLTVSRSGAGQILRLEGGAVDWSKFNFGSSASLGLTIGSDQSSEIFSIHGMAPTGSFLILSTGNVGIGTMSPGEKLTVAGTIESTTGGVKFPDGTLQATAVSPIQKYDSGWFLVTTGGSYTKTHNLGSQLLITQILFARDSGGSPDLNHVTCIVGHNDANVDWRYVNLVTGFIYDITPTTLKINTGREAVAVIPHDTYWVTRYTSGWYRVLALRID